MDLEFERFIRKLGINDVLLFEDCRFKSRKYDKSKDLFSAVIESKSLFTFLEAKLFLDALDNAPFKVYVEFDYLEHIKEEDIYNLLKDQFVYKTKLSNDSMPKINILNNTIKIEFYGSIHKQSFELVLEEWEQLLDDLSLRYDLETHIIESQDEINQRNEQLKQNVEIIKNAYASLINNHNNSQRIKGDYQDISLIDISEELNEVHFVGKIFYADIRTLRNGKSLASFYVYDKTSSIEVIAFSNNSKLKKEYLEELVKNQPAIEVKGVVSISNYSNELQVRARTLVISNDFTLEDQSQDDIEEKRVELHLHTKMSTMDGVSTITDYINQAKKWGWKSIGITDHANVQAYPEAQASSSKAGIKMLYGIEFYMIDEELEHITNPSDDILNSATYVFFDLETTGLSSRYDKIIEFGAVKVRNGEIIDTMQMFIDPEMKIPDQIVRLTHITDSMVKGKDKISEALIKIRSFISDSILVAHNASFDCDFLNEALIHNNYDMLTNPTIDTLSLAWYLYPFDKAHNLGALCRKFAVEYDDTKAHRAIYDAEVLSKVYLGLIEKISKNNKEFKHRDLMSLNSDELVNSKNIRPKHVTCYAKNKQGLKDLFKLVSESCTTYLNGVARITRRQLQEYRANLLIGSSCLNGEVFDAALRRTKKVLKEKIDFYDYIEVQPLENYSFLVNDGQIHSLDRVKSALTDLITISKLNNKIVVATSDAHYVRPSQKIYRDVYIITKAVGGTRHPLNPNRRDRQPRYENPDQHLRSTKEMLEAFNFLEESLAYEIVIKNTNYIADLIEPLYPIHKETFPPSIENCDNLLKQRVANKAKELYGENIPQIIQERLDAELDGIIKNGYAVQFYIASEIVRKANQDGYIVGSRGSVGSSLVAFMADITEVNALPPHYRCPKCKHFELSEDKSIKSGYDLIDKPCPHCHTKMIQDGQNLPFAVFLGFKAEKVPDIDLNFPGDYQAQAHLLTKQFLGSSGNTAFRAGTIETVAEKTAYGYVLGYYENYLKLSEEEIRKIPSPEKRRIAIGCQEVKRTTGQHPGGIIVIPSGYEVYDFTPYQYPADDKTATWYTTHFDFHAIHDNVLKLDLLGHVDPVALKFLENATGIKAKDIPLNDKKVHQVFASREILNCSSNVLNEKTGSLGLPEFGTNLTRQMVDEIQPKSFADLVLISGLSHGTDVWNGNAQDLINNKVCNVDGIIACRDDVMLYLMSYGVDNSKAFKTMESVRKGKKIPQEYLEDIVSAGVPDYYIESANKCKYLFPKAHAIAYVTMAVRIAWFKVYRPLEYYACFFSIRSKQYDIETMTKGIDAMMNLLRSYEERRKSKNPLTPKEEEIEKTLFIAIEMYERGYHIKNIDINKSHATKFIVDEESKSIIAPFVVIDGLGEGPAQSVVDAREIRPFYSQDDLSNRTSLNKTIIDKLRKLHVLDDIPESDRITLF